MTEPDDKAMKKLYKAHQKGFEAGSRGEFPNCPYQPDSEEVAYWDQGITDGRNFLLEVSRQ